MPHVAATSVTPDDLVGAVRTGLAALADPAKAGPLQTYMRSSMPYRGVTARYAATTLARHRHYREHQQPHTIELYRHFVVTGAWWDHVDEVATHLVRGLLERHPNAITPQLHDWARDDDLWVRRSAIVCQVGRRDDLDRDLLVNAVDANLDGRPAPHRRSRRTAGKFFVHKAIGWALRDHARTDPEWGAHVRRRPRGAAQPS